MFELINENLLLLLLLLKFLSLSFQKHARL